METYFDRNVESVVFNLVTVKKFQQRFHAAVDIEVGEGYVCAWVSPRFGFEVCRQLDTIDVGVTANVNLPPLEPGRMGKAFDSPDVEDFVAVIVGHHPPRNEIVPTEQVRYRFFRLWNNN